MAIQAGLNLDDFWYEDFDYVNLVIKSYFDRINYEAWAHGFYVYEAVSLVVGGIFNKDVGTYPKEPYNTSDNKIDYEEIKEDKEIEFRNALMECF